MVFTKHLLAKAVCRRSIKVLGWQPGSPKTREHGFPTKRRDKTSDSSMGSVALWSLQKPEQCLQSQIKCLIGPGAPKTREHDFRQNVTALWVL